MKPEPPGGPSGRVRRAHLPKVQGDTTRMSVDVPTAVADDLKVTARAVRDQLPGAPHVAVGQVMAALAVLVHSEPEVRRRVVSYLGERVVQ